VGLPNHPLSEVYTQESMTHPQVAGKLIAVEGLDGSGKSTQLYLLKRWLESEGVRVYFTEWNSSEIVRLATKKGKKRKLLTPTTFSLIHATDFGDRYERQILPLMQTGFIVLADRYMYTAFARDVVRGCSREWVQSVYSFALRPDITFYFDTPLDIALNRILSGRPRLKYHEAGMDLGISSDPYESFRVFQGRILKEYESMKSEFGFRQVDATRPIREQHYEVREIIRGLINLPEFMAGAEVR
jgi:dTMP kinase